MFRFLKDVFMLTCVLVLLAACAIYGLVIGSWMPILCGFGAVLTVGWMTRK